MLDLDSPSSAYVFAASNQLETILHGCKHITILQNHRRTFHAEIIRPTYAALRWLNAERFKALTRISAAIDETERQMDQLAALPTRFPTTSSNPRCCPACGGPLENKSEYEPTRYCSKCLNMIMGGLQSLRMGFGTFAI